MVTVRRLGADDDASLATIAHEEEDFDVEGRSESRELPREAARAFLADPNTLFWIAESAGRLVGFLSCQLVRRRSDSPELLLYEIGVRAEHRRSGVGRSLLDTMTSWMDAHSIDEVWVLADNDGAVKFYEACGFTVSEGPAIYMTRVRE
jgi:ribosomal protein S18 acetylase RimI-like enzyme